MSGKKGRSGRKKNLGTQIEESMKLLDEKLPSLILKLNELAEHGDREALIYLIDRRMGKPRQQTDLDIKGGEQIGAGTMVELFRIIAQKRAELDSPIRLAPPNALQGITETKKGENVQRQGVTEGSNQGEGKALQE